MFTPRPILVLLTLLAAWLGATGHAARPSGPAAYHVERPTAPQQPVWGDHAPPSAPAARVRRGGFQPADRLDGPPDAVLLPLMAGAAPPGRTVWADARFAARSVAEGVARRARAPPR